MKTYKITRTRSLRNEAKPPFIIEANTFLITSTGAAVFYNGSTPNLDVTFAIHAEEWEIIEVIEE